MVGTVADQVPWKEVAAAQLSHMLPCTRASLGLPNLSTFHGMPESYFLFPHEISYFLNLASNSFPSFSLKIKQE